MPQNKPLWAHFSFRVIQSAAKGEKHCQKQNKRHFRRYFALLRSPPSVMRCACTRAPMRVLVRLSRVYVRAYAHARAFCVKHKYFLLLAVFLFLYFLLFFSFFLLSLFISFFFPLGCGGFPFFLLSFFFLAFSLFLILFFFLFLCVSNSFF